MASPVEMYEQESDVTVSESASPAMLNNSHRLTNHLNRLLSAPASSRISRAVGELAVAMDHAAHGEPFAVAVSAVSAGHRLGFTAMTLAALWGRWGIRTCLVDLGTGSKSLQGAIASTKPDLGAACRAAAEGQRLTSISRLHSKLPSTSVIAGGDADALQLLSTGQLHRLVKSLKQSHDRVVIAAPALDTGFPMLSLYDACDRLILSLVAGKSRSGPIRELTEHAMALGMRPVDAIWYDG